MKKLLVVLSIGLTNASAQTTYELECIPVYDSLGNVYITRGVYDHIPTSQDSAEFFENCNRRFKDVEITSTEEKKYTVKVAKIKTDKNGEILIKPIGKYRSEWYKCNEKTIKVGDSVIITRKDAVH